MKYILPILSLFLFVSSLWSQEKYQISGQCIDGLLGEDIPSVSIYESATNTIAFSDSLGRYHLELVAGVVHLSVSYVGYASIDTSFSLTRDVTLNFYLKRSAVIEEVKVLDKKVEDVVSNPQIGKIRLSPKRISSLPSLGGEPDLIKALQLLPGVQSGREGRSGLYVRGGGVDQNLILVDGVALYDVSHLGGFFSIFNGDAIESVSLNKGSFPARYGGRLSSILEVKMKSGQSDKIRAKAGVGLIASRFTISGPIKKGKSSFVLSARRTYPDIPITQIKKWIEESGPNGHLDKWKLHFYDIYAKGSFPLGEKSKLVVSGFMNKDVFAEGYTEGQDEYIQSNEDGNIIRNNMSAFRWIYQPKKQMQISSTASFVQYNSRYYSRLEEKGLEVSLQEEIFESDIQDWTIKSDAVWDIKKSQFRVGIAGIYHKFLPGSYRLLSSSTVDTATSSSLLTSFENVAYVENDWKWGKFRTNIGVHLSYYQTKENNYFYPEPRVAFRYLMGKSWSLKASYSNMVQYTNLVNLDGTGVTNIWFLTSGKLRPQKSNQVSLGVAKKRNNYEFSLNGYYKEMEDIVVYQGNLLYFSNKWVDNMVQGNGQSYGAEMFLNKKQGKLSGWLGYTLSWNWRQFAEINDGVRYPFRYDRRHDIKVVVNYAKSQRASFSAVWLFGTGNAVTLPVGIAQVWASGYDYSHKYYRYALKKMYIFSKKNEFREPVYHRLDLSVRLKKKKRRGTRTWGFGLYNAYGRANPYYLYVDEVLKQDDDGNAIFDHYGIFRKTLFTIVPSISYTFELK